jgi:signal transduction histidine kinase/CHASE2 domain-containing sensor protein
MLALLVHAQLPGLERYAQDWLVRARGTLPVPDDIAIVAIDEPSISRLGPFPWPRSVMARIIDRVAAARPKVIALDVLYVTAGVEREDAELAQAIGRAGNVVAAAQLIEPSPGERESRWLLPIPSVVQAASGLGHVNVLVESEGVARDLLIRTMDHAGRIIAAMPVEAIRVAGRLPPGSIVDMGQAISIGQHRIPVHVPPSTVVLSKAASTEILRPARMMIDYIGPTGSFASRTFSAADVLDGRTTASDLGNRYVLIGATAAGTGERFPSPFLHSDNAQTGQHGTLMPGVEVLANALNTILRERFYTPVPDWAVFVWSAAVAAFTLAALSAAQGSHELGRQALAILAIAGAILLVAYLAVSQLLLILPLAPGFVSLSAAGLLGLMRRSLVTSARLDRSIADLIRAGSVLVPDAQTQPALETIARIAQSSGVTLFARENGSLVRKADRGMQQGASTRRVELENGILELIYETPASLPDEVLRLCAGIAQSCLELIGKAARQPSGFWPRALEAKARMLGALNSQLLERAQFVDRALRSAEDGLLITGPDGTIRFSNHAAAVILQSTEQGLIGRNFFHRLAECEQAAPDNLQDSLARLLLDRAQVEREVAIRGPRARQYVMRLAPVAGGDGPVSGIVVSLSDITRHKELQQTKNDVIALVSHEMRTPLAAIQGMSELLANYEMDPERSREMNIAINDEVKRLTRMITEYLDITRLESGAVVLRRAPLRVDNVVERTILMHEPIAAARGIVLVPEIDPQTPPVLADGDLIARAAGNLISNAVKYSPAETQVRVAVRPSGSHVEISVSDQGYGIPPADLTRIFEKFYRVPRVQDADVPGAGLGLALVREVAELHGGAVSVKSEPGSGSTFTLTIPIEEGRN